MDNIIETAFNECKNLMIGEMRQMLLSGFTLEQAIKFFEEGS